MGNDTRGERESLKRKAILCYDELSSWAVKRGDLRGGRSNPSHCLLAENFGLSGFLLRLSIDALPPKETQRRNLDLGLLWLSWGGFGFLVVWKRWICEPFLHQEENVAC